jgi:hypothetical protein
VFYPDTDNVSSTSKVVARSIAIFRFNALTFQRFNASTKPYDSSRFNDPLAKAFGVQFAAGLIRRGGRFNEFLARQSLSDGGPWRQPALYERRIKREASCPNS